MSTSSARSKVVLAGGSGYLGRLLADSFSNDGWEVVLLSRSSNSTLPEAVGEVYWDGKTMGPWKEALEGASALINLAGRSVDCRYTKKNRESILKSRVDSTRALSEAVEACSDKPKVWLNASSMATYGQCGGNELPFDEDSPTTGKGFLEEVTQAWENEFFKHSWADVRKVALRISFVLGRESGAFPLLAKFARLGLGGAQGSGKQWMSWLHEDDFVGIVRFLIEHNSLAGSYNLAAPHPLTNAEFMHCLRAKLAPLGIGLPAPAIGVRLGCFLIGSAPELALQSRKVVSARLKEEGYQFKYPLLDHAVDALIA